MIQDLLRAILAIVVMSVAAGLVIETRCHIAAIDIAHRSAIGQQANYCQPQPHFEPAGRLKRLGRATLDLADAALGIAR
jgi:hypothetical protein